MYKPLHLFPLLLSTYNTYNLCDLHCFLPLDVSVLVYKVNNPIIIRSSFWNKRVDACICKKKEGGRGRNRGVTVTGQRSRLSLGKLLCGAPSPSPFIHLLCVYYNVPYINIGYRIAFYHRIPPFATIAAWTKLGTVKSATNLREVRIREDEVDSCRCLSIYVLRSHLRESCRL